MKLTILILATLCVAALATFDHPRLASAVKNELAKHGEDWHNAKIDVLIRFKQQANRAALERTLSGVRHTDRGHHMVAALRSVALPVHARWAELLAARALSHRLFWLVNLASVEGMTAKELLWLVEHEDVERIELDGKFQAALPEPEEDIEPETPNAVEWNVQWVGAPSVWAKGFNGTGFVVANADTGVAWEHPALKNQYRGFQNGQANHDYNWFDAVKNTGSSCGADSPQPCDDNGHGTHTTGTAVGTDGGANQIGVAPGAKWIACRNMNAGMGAPSLYIACLQFFVAPTDRQGNNPKPELAPHVIGNSYGCPGFEGCKPDSLFDAVTNVVNAGIFMSVSAGNDGPFCSSVNAPPGIYSNVLAVAALARQSDSLATYSSRGPVTVDGSNRQSPDIAAPGSSVRSAYPPNVYRTLSGTSMASPVLTGFIPILYQSNPSLTRDVPVAKKHIEMRAAPTPAYTGCSSPVTGPNNGYGWGQINFPAAINNTNVMF